MTPEPGRGPRAYQLYGRRKGPALRQRQQHLIETLLPRLSIDLESDLRDCPRLFQPVHERLWLEIGFGGGEHLAERARENPDIGFIGCEPFVNGVAKLLAVIEAESLSNIRLHAGDARDLLPRLGAAAFERIFLLFPDPWPKARHQKRRFVSQATLGELHRILEPGGVFRFASDWPDYVDHVRSEIGAHGGFTLLSPDGTARPTTRYEQKARAAGRESVYLDFRRV
ncbi:MAG: tRNA (guanosine(46)-N7)-methyltransferase TrmB [Parvibaculaceae bacterium]